MKKNNIDYASLTIEEIQSLNNYQYYKYKVWAESKKRRDKAKTDFLHHFEESCSKYEV